MPVDRPRYTSPPDYQVQPAGPPPRMDTVEAVLTQIGASLASVDLSVAELVAKTRSFATVTVAVTRPADTSNYANGDAWADSTTTPTAGGFEVANAARTSGGSGVIRGVVVVSSDNAGPALEGELWVFDSPVTAVADNAPFTLSSADAAKLCGVVPFELTVEAGSNSLAVVAADIAFTAAGSASLWFLVRLAGAYAPVSAETLRARFKIEHMS